MGEPSAKARSGETALAPKLPLRLGRFTLCEELGSGGMATVYLARMELAAGLERLAALKTIHPHLAKERPFVDMFLDEARIASHVTHPNVCSTHDFGEVNGVYYLAMEYLIGEPLFDVINRLVEHFDEVREVLPFLAARIIADACEGLHAAHSARGPDGEALRIVHRDVSPQNLFLTYDGSVKVVDFGCAKAAERVAHTSTGVMKGKVGYAAPEQLKSDRTVDARADVWALGVCFWEALTLSPLFSRETAVATAMAVLQDEIERADVGRDWVPAGAADIADKALQRHRDDRYQSARELSRDLRKFISDNGYTLESAELAEWMDFLFAERHQAQVERAKRVRELDLSDVHDVTADDVELLDSAPAPLEAVRLPDDDDDALPELDERVVEVSGPVPRRSLERPAAGAEPPPLAKRKGGGRWLLALLLLAGLGVAGYYLQLYYEPAPWFLELFGMEPSAPADPSTTPEGGETSGDDEASEASRSGEATEATEDEGSARAAEADEAGSDATGEADEAGSDATGEEGAATAEAPASGATPTSGRSSGRRSSRGSSSVTTVVSGGGTTSYGSPTTGDPGGSSAPTPPTPRVATGFVSITASGGGWAEIYADGRRLGRTPLRSELPEGRHRVRILPYGQSPGETITVDVEGGLEESLTIDVASPE